MDFYKTVVMWMIVALSFGIFFFMLMLSSLFYLSCLISVVAGLSIIILARWAWESVDTKRLKKEASESSDRYAEETHKKKKKDSIVDRIKGKKTCENCGSELVYKEELDSYYCPQCHDYK